jgi:glycosyltransferase involved in cell wall biosynthesis
MPVTVIVEPDHGGHRFQAAANVARFAGRTDEVLLLTSAGAAQTEEFRTYLADVELKVDDRFDGIYPPTRAMARAVAEICRTNAVSRVVVMDADQSLKRWWYVAAAAFRGLPRRPRVVFMLTRYPAKLTLTDRVGWKLRVSKGTLALAAMATRTLHRVAGFAGRDDMSRGWLVKRARDPAICSAHSRNRDAIRADLGLPADRKLVGICGVIYERKNAPLILDAILASGADDADLLLAGMIKPEVAEWLAALPEARANRIIVRDGFLPNDVLDQLVAASDVVAIALTNNGPSGIMGKALAADVPVISAGSAVRARELKATGGGVSTELTVKSIASALRTLFAPGGIGVRNYALPPATAEVFAAAVLGTDPQGAMPARRSGGA